MSFTYNTDQHWASASPQAPGRTSSGADSAAAAAPSSTPAVPRPGSNGNGEKVHVRLEITPALDAKLNELAGKIGGTPGDVLSRAIALMDVAVEANRQGKRIGIADDDQPLAAEIVGITKG